MSAIYSNADSQGFDIEVGSNKVTINRHSGENLTVSHKVIVGLPSIKEVLEIAKVDFLAFCGYKGEEGERTAKRKLAESGYYLAMQSAMLRTENNDLPWSHLKQNSDSLHHQGIA